MAPCPVRQSNLGHGDPGEGSQKIPCWINGDGCWRQETWRWAGGPGRGTIARMTVRTRLACIATGETPEGIPSPASPGYMRMSASRQHESAYCRPPGTSLAPDQRRKLQGRASGLWQLPSLAPTKPYRAPSALRTSRRARTLPCGGEG